MTLNAVDKFFARPALGVILGVIPGILLAEVLTSVAVFLVLLFVSIVTLLFCGWEQSRSREKRRPPRIWSYGVVLLLSVTLGYGAAFRELYDDFSTEVPERGEILACLTEPSTRTEKALRMSVKVISGTENLRGKRLMLYRYAPMEANSLRLTLGDTIHCSLRRITPREAITRTGYKNWLRSKNCVATAVVISDFNTYPGSGFAVSPREKAVTLREHALDIREIFLDRISILPYPSEVKSFLATVALGYRDDGLSSISEAFRSVGAAHLLSVSGFHLAVVCGFFLLILGWLDNFPRFRAIKPIAVILLAWAFAYITGLSAATVRAALMLTFYQLSVLLVLPRNTLNILFATALFLLVFHPGYLFDIGFQLSFISVLSILLFYPFFGVPVRDAMNPFFHYLYNGIALCLSAQLLTFPLVLYHFGATPLLFLWSNLPLVALTSVIIPLALGVILCLPFLINGLLGNTLITLLGWFCRQVTSTLDFFAPLQHWDFRFQPSSIQIIGIYLIIFAFYLLFSPRMPFRIGKTSQKTLRAPWISSKKLKKAIQEKKRLLGGRE